MHHIWFKNALVHPHGPVPALGAAVVHPECTKTHFQNMLVYNFQKIHNELNNITLDRIVLLYLRETAYTCISKMLRETPRFLLILNMQYWVLLQNINFELPIFVLHLKKCVFGSLKAKFAEANFRSTYLYVYIWYGVWW